MTKEERQKELRERLEPEIRFEYRLNPVTRVGSVVGHLGTLPRVRMDYEVPDDDVLARAFVRMRIMEVVFKKEGCL